MKEFKIEIYNGNNPNVVIPDGVSEIGSSARMSSLKLLTPAKKGASAAISEQIW